METIGGYRLVRLLGRGKRADVFLGHADLGHGNLGNEARVVVETSAVGGVPGADEIDLDGISERRPRAVAIKVYRENAGGVDAEIEALARSSSRHLLRLVDLATAPDGQPALVLGRLGGLSLAQLLVSRGELDHGEAVTILSPLCGGVSELHRVGVVHSRLRLDTVFFDELGAPVIGGFGHVELVGEMPERQHVSSLTPAALAACRPALQDLAALVVLARSVVETTADTPARADLLAWLEDVSSARAGFAEELTDRLFELAAPLPVAFAQDRPQLLTRSPASLEARHTSPRRTQTNASTDRSKPAWRLALMFPDWLSEAVERTIPPGARAAVAAARQFAARVRRPLWFAAAAAVVLLTVALTFIPAGTTVDANSSSGSREIGAPSRSTPPEAPVRNADGAAELEPDADADTDTDTSANADSPVDAASAAIAGDDPVAAAVALLERRAECFDSRSAACLDDVDQPDSAAFEADGYRVRHLQEGASHDDVRLDGLGVTLVERMGDSAIVAITMPVTGLDSAPASLLLVKSEAGWRIRDVILG